MIESVLDSWDHKDVRHSSGPEVNAMLLMHIELPRASLVACTVLLGICVPKTTLVCLV